MHLLPAYALHVTRSITLRRCIHTTVTGRYHLLGSVPGVNVKHRHNIHTYDHVIVLVLSVLCVPSLYVRYIKAYPERYMLRQQYARSAEKYVLQV